MAATGRIDIKLQQIIFDDQLPADGSIDYHYYINSPLNINDLDQVVTTDLLLFKFTGTPTQILKAIGLHSLTYMVYDGVEYEDSGVTQRLRMLSSMNTRVHVNVYVAAEVGDVITGDGVGILMNEYMNTAYAVKFDALVTDYSEGLADRV